MGAAGRADPDIGYSRRHEHKAHSGSRGRHRGRRSWVRRSRVRTRSARNMTTRRRRLSPNSRSSHRRRPLPPLRDRDADRHGSEGQGGQRQGSRHEGNRYGEEEGQAGQGSGCQACRQAGRRKAVTVAILSVHGSRISDRAPVRWRRNRRRPRSSPRGQPVGVTSRSTRSTPRIGVVPGSRAFGSRSFACAAHEVSGLATAARPFSSRDPGASRAQREADAGSECLPSRSSDSHDPRGSARAALPAGGRRGAPWATRRARSRSPRPARCRGATCTPP